MDDSKRFESALYAVSERLREKLVALPPVVKNNTEEIRLRRGLPVALTVKGETVFITQNGQTSFIVTRDLLKTENADLEESFKLLCQSSVYAHADELKNGYIMMKYGHRAGICGTLTASGSMHDISSVNIRIAREVIGCANDITRNYKGGGLLIAGPPGSGKTTILRDFIRQLSDGLCGKIYRVAVIDSRGELSGSSEGVSVNNLGVGTDILITQDKASGIEIAVRTMFPDIVAFDEIGTAEELKRVSESFCAGVSIVTTAHAGHPDELMKRNVTRQLLQSSAISLIAFLPALHGGTIKLINVKELNVGIAG